jgi:hypothetical protein
VKNGLSGRGPSEYNGDTAEKILSMGQSPRGLTFVWLSTIDSQMRSQFVPRNDVVHCEDIHRRCRYPR